MAYKVPRKIKASKKRIVSFCRMTRRRLFPHKMVRALMEMILFSHFFEFTSHKHRLSGHMMLFLIFKCVGCYRRAGEYLMTKGIDLSFIVQPL